MRFKIDWASLIVGSKFTVFALIYFVFEGNFQVQAPGGLYLEGRFNGGFLRYEFGGLIHVSLSLQGYRVNDCVSPAHDGSFEPEGIIHHLSGYGSSSNIYFSVFCFYSTTFCWSLNVPIPQHGVGFTRG